MFIILKYLRCGKHFAIVSTNELKFVILLWFTHNVCSDSIIGKLTWLVNLLLSRIKVFSFLKSCKKWKFLVVC